MAEDFRVEKQQRGRWGEGGAVRLRSNIDPHWSNLTFVALCIMQTSNLVCRLCCHSNSKSFIWKKIHERRAVKLVHFSLCVRDLFPFGHDREHSGRFDSHSPSFVQSCWKGH